MQMTTATYFDRLPVDHRETVQKVITCDRRTDMNKTFNPVQVLYEIYRHSFYTTDIYKIIHQLDQRFRDA
jgi:hypothetical protein